MSAPTEADVTTLTGALGPCTSMQAAAALSIYLAGSSLDTVSRQTGISRYLLGKWVKLAGITRTRDEVRAMQRAALDAARPIR